MNTIISILKMMFLVTAVSFIFGSSCNKDGSKPCTMLTPYNFNVTSEFTPQREIYSVGDTIFLKSIFSKVLINSISNQQVDYSNSLGVVGNFKAIFMDTTNLIIQESLNKFSTYVFKGDQASIPNSPNSGLSIKYLEDSTTYEFIMSIKLLSKGLFYIGVTNLGSQGLQGKNCTNAGFNMTVINSNKNLHLFQYALGYPADSMLANNIYCFRVQ
jgi:hypothetical protein